MLRVGPSAGSHAPEHFDEPVDLGAVGLHLEGEKESADRLQAGKRVPLAEILDRS